MSEFTTRVARTALGFVLASVVWAQSARAASGDQATVEAVQMPAWAERDGSRIPLAPGMELRDQDQIRTGANARLLLRMPEGSAVKLGENGFLVIDSLSMARGTNRFSGAMKVLVGAFRFTTDALRKVGGVRRDINITVATLTMGVRGTDVWGKAASDRDIVCLIDGRIEVTRGADAPIVMDQPLSFYIAPKDRPPLPVAPVPPEQLKQWAAETDIQAGVGATRRGGSWKVVLMRAESMVDALDLYGAVRAAGYAAEILPSREQTRRVYDVRLPHLPSRGEAQALADSLRGRMGIGEPRVTH